ncbi:MAG: hypothetical protein RR571_09160, partial [Anaerorhabdus sp.]
NMSHPYAVDISKNGSRLKIMEILNDVSNTISILNCILKHKIYQIVVFFLVYYKLIFNNSD